MASASPPKTASSKPSEVNRDRIRSGRLLYYGGQDHYAADPNFYDTSLDDEMARAEFEKFAATATRVADPEKIRALHAGTPHATPLPDASYWTHGAAYPMDKDADLDALYIQAGTWSDRVARIADGTLEVRTPHPDRTTLTNTDTADLGHAYFWFPDFAEGDIRLDYDFQILEHGGLSLFMAQAAGIHGERFMEDYPRRTTGSMRMVAWEDVRNYHLEYYREMDDIRNDLATFALVKNPWLHPLSYATRTWQWQTDRWYHLCFAQQEGSLRLFIDDDLVIDARDDAFTNNGPLLQRGYVALRCMFRTAMRFKNVSIRWRPLLPEEG